MTADDSRIVMTDFVHGRCLEELYSNAYLFVLPSDVEGMALSLLEAMSYGNCCVVSDIKENTEVVEDYAICFQKSNVSDLKEKLVQLINDSDLVKHYQELSEEFICRKYDWEQIVEETLQVYKSEK